MVEAEESLVLSGASLWDCALVLAKWFDTESWPVNSLKGKRVIEVGAGLGLPGLAAATLGADVIVTDRQPLIAALKRNISANHLEDRVKADVLEWSSMGDSKLGKIGTNFEIILGSDLLFDVAIVADLSKALLELSSPETQIFISHELREKSVECFRVLGEKGFQWSRIPNEELHPDWRCDDIGIFRFYRPTLCPVAELNQNINTPGDEDDNSN